MDFGPYYGLFATRHTRELATSALPYAPVTPADGRPRLLARIRGLLPRRGPRTARRAVRAHRPCQDET
jgi:hypothetical protein